jgi:hypothetical protein
VTLRILRGTLAKVEESSEWTSVVKSAENRAKFCKALDGEPLFNALYGMYTVTLNELKAVLKVSAQASQSGVVTKIQWNQRARTNSRK